jgi:RNA polymerase sigma-70 factor (ECF subfamily)
MATDFSEVNDRAAPLSSLAEKRCNEIYEKQSRRVYSLALWMTTGKIAAQKLASRTFLRALSFGGHVSTEQVDQAFVAEVRDLMTVEAPALEVPPAPSCKSIHGRMKLADLEKAVAELPAAERLIFLLHDIDGYDQRRISRLLRFDRDQVLMGLHRARMLIRGLVCQMHETTPSGLAY